MPRPVTGTEPDNHRRFSTLYPSSFLLIASLLALCIFKQYLVARADPVRPVSNLGGYGSFLPLMMHQPTPTPTITRTPTRTLTPTRTPTPTQTATPDIADQQTLLSVADACVLEGYPTINVGDAADMWAGYDDGLNPMARIVRSLVRFDIASLPPGRTVTKATLRVYLVSSWDFPNRGRVITTHRVSSDWSEPNVNWNNKPGYTDSYGSMSIVHGAERWYEFDVTDLVSAWYRGTYPNYGIMLRGPEASGSDSGWRGFSTREGPYRPQLVIDFAASASPLLDTYRQTNLVDNAGSIGTLILERLKQGQAELPQTQGKSVETVSDIDP